MSDSPDLEAANKALERDIQRLLTAFENDHGVTIDYVNVDTRMWANCSTEVFVKRSRHE